MSKPVNLYSKNVNPELYGKKLKGVLSNLILSPDVMSEGRSMLTLKSHACIFMYYAFLRNLLLESPSCTRLTFIL
jgi:hypothetical protein